MSSLWLDGGVLRGYYGEGGDVVLPDFIYDVGGYVFRNHTGVRSVTIPEGALDVGYGTFSGCTGLVKVVLPDTIQRIDMYAFSGCEHLPEVRLPAKLKVLRDSTFINCVSLQKIHIPVGVETIEFHAFLGCDRLTEIIALGVTTVEDPIIDRIAKCVLPKVPINELTSKGMKDNGALGYCSYPALYGNTAARYAAYAEEHCDALAECAVQCGFPEPLQYFRDRGLLNQTRIPAYLELSQRCQHAEITALLLDCSAKGSEDVWLAFEKEFEL